MVCWALLAVMRAHPQDYHFSGFLLNQVYVNPSYAAMVESPEGGLTYRNQWPGIPATFVTYGASFVYPVKSMNSGLGINLLNDVQGSGVISRTSATLLYGYRLQLGRSWQLGAGIGASLVFKQFSADELVFRSDILNDLGYSYGTVVMGNYNKYYPDFGVGISLVNAESGISAGLSVSHLTRPDETENSLSGDRLPLKYTAFVSGRLGRGGSNTGSTVTLVPALFFSQQGISQELMWGSQAMINSLFIVGAWARQNLSFHFDSFILNAGISYRKYNFLYSYDVNVKKFDLLSTKMAAHEVTFLYRLEYKGLEYRSRSRRATDCPAYD